MNYAVVIPAAGQGRRMQAAVNKAFLTLQGRPIIAHTLAVFQADPRCERIVLVASENELDEMQALAEEAGATKADRVVAGGSERQDSVRAGAAQVMDAPLLLVHDGARPFVAIERIHALLLEAEQSGAALLAVPATDTIKQVDQEGRVKQTLKRSELWAAQTPQAFRPEVLQQAYAYADETGFQGTDDVSLVEAAGGEVAVVEGDYDNIKLTTPEDMTLAEAILAKRAGEAGT
ncbi:2-C-methyl-D-erythritol 4-phosphate cytidylyltransferase [Salsuginibacillus halophilus]|uniref:2-C-methyl-D-erythritol 4-phosphate cytidylyltransferase n=1 Tax=Salsuginibacillus halophilus TaxID=517424 RepID=A0A2P8H525_9BACI|nr:2-C-methyl-D-erythritol 4-phosphate cytidylyltransferase [Salsuginibacillus halophilus]PSL41299.1 2-C-methyl-D-erythritol 4-phosphate cytidylyltransferase [Salsuginibacillus halophilus]